MGVLRFQLPPGPAPDRTADLRRIYVTGLDRIPERVGVEFRQEVVNVYRDRIESVRAHVPWPVVGSGTPVVATATLVERDAPYNLEVELARGKLNDVLNQAADWRHLGLQVPEALEGELRRARRAFSVAATSRDDPAAASTAAQECLAAAHRAGRALVLAYTEQVLARRLEHSAKLPTYLACGVEGPAKNPPWAGPLVEAINAARVPCSWRSIAPEEGQFRWEEFDAAVHWSRKRRLAVLAGPLVELRAGALPDWLWLWEGDYEAIAGMVAEFVRAAVTRYRGKVQSWHVVGRPGSGEILGLTEEEQFRLTARILQVARLADPDAQLVVDLDRPWADWMAGSFFHLGPLHLADNLVRAEVGLTGLGLEIAPGFSNPGSPMHDLLDFSKILDLFALLNLPLHLTMVAPASAEADPKADPAVRVEAAQWPAAPDEAQQRDWANDWVALAIAKPYVRSVSWTHASDAAPHLYPNGGLFRADHAPRPILDVLKGFRSRFLP